METTKTTQTVVAAPKVTPVERHLASAMTFMKQGAAISAPFSHSQLAQLTGCAWLSSVTMLSALRKTNIIVRHGKTPVIREGVEIDKQAPAEMKEENTFLIFANQEVYDRWQKHQDETAAAEKAKSDAVKAAAKELAKQKKAAETAAKRAAAKIEADKAKANALAASVAAEPKTE